MSGLGLSPKFRAWIRKRNLYADLWFAGGVMVLLGAFPWRHTFDWMLGCGAGLLLFAGTMLDETKDPPP